MPTRVIHLIEALAMAALLVSLTAGPARSDENDAAAATEDVVYVYRDGLIQGVHGDVLAEGRDGSVVIRTEDGVEMRFPGSRVARVERDVAVRPESPPTPRANTRSAPRAEPQVYRRPADYRDPSTALLFSMLVPGGGQFYNGEVGKGMLALGGTIGGIVMFAANYPVAGYGVAESGNAGASLAGLGIVLVTGIWSMVDAPQSARRINDEAYALEGGRDGVQVCVAPDRHAGETCPVVGVRWSF